MGVVESVAVVKLAPLVMRNENRIKGKILKQCMLIL